MKHVFIVNPAAGKQDSSAQVSALLQQSCSGIDYELHITKASGEATSFIREYCGQNPSPVRFYACGGDGTLNEVVNGVIGCENASVSCYPIGSGNDFVKYYGGKERFMDIAALINAEEEPVDAVRVDGKYCINACHFGFDSYVAMKISEMKTKPLIGGKNVYTTSVAIGLIKGMKHNCEMSVDGKPFFAGDFLLCTVANGTHVGGSFNCAPRSKNNDGLLEICLVKRITRIGFMRLVGSYTKGTHLDDARFEKCLMYIRGKKVEVRSDEPGFGYSLDGEVVEGKSFTAEVVPGAVRFAVPKRDN